MEPIPETSRAVDEFGPFAEFDLLSDLNEKAGQVQELVPQCVGMSLASIEHGVSFTLVATDVEIAALDGVQYLNGGPCVAAVKGERVLGYSDVDLMDESDWHLFAQATAASGITSTLTLPIVSSEHVVGSINLYGTTPDAFNGHHEAIAHIFNAWAPGAVTNADLSFSTRETSAQAPRVLEEDIRLKAALGILMRSHDTGLSAAQELLSQAARRAGTSEVAIAERIVAGFAHSQRELEA